MNTTDAIISRICIALLQPDGRSVPVRVSLRWRPEDPFVVQVLFRTGNAERPEVGWDLSRELLAEGLVCKAGIGDVRIEPDGTQSDVLRLHLSSPGGEVTFLLDSRTLAEFLDCTFDMIPLGEESLWVSFDAELAALLDAPA
jgi:hypothetical protein